MSTAREVDPIDAKAEQARKAIGTTYTREDFRRMIELPKGNACFNAEASKSTIQHFVDGIGDRNPLYRDEEYAEKSKYGGIIAPPCFILSVVWAEGSGTGAGFHSWYSGGEFEWFRPIYIGDKIEWKSVIPSDVVVKTSKYAGKSMILYNDTEYSNQRGETIAVARQWHIFGAFDKAASAGKYKDVAHTQAYTREEIEIIHAEQDSEVVRGDTPRYWEDVNVGEDLTPMVFGPLDMHENIAFVIGCGVFINRSMRIWRPIQQKWGGDNDVFYDPITNAMVNLEHTHFDGYWAQRVGGPGAYDFGAQRPCWMGSFLTNWMGDDGFLWKMRAELRRFNILGDTTWLKGKVAEKYCEDEGTRHAKYCVDIDCWAENQRKEVTAPGKATVILPSREHGPVVYPAPRHVA